LDSQNLSIAEYLRSEGSLYIYAYIDCDTDHARDQKIRRSATARAVFGKSEKYNFVES